MAKDGFARTAKGTFSCAVLALALFARCGAGSRTPLQQSMWQLHNAYAGIARYRDSLGALPDSAPQVCEAQVDWCSLRSDDWLRDGWGRSMLYKVSGSTFSVRSPGPDGRMMTPDDLVLDSGVEQQMVRALAGCYELSRPVWGRFEGRRVHLDTQTVETGAYRVYPDVRNFRAQWYPLPPLDAYVAWSSAEAAFTMYLSQRGDSLVGSAAGRPVVARRVPC